MSIFSKLRAFCFRSQPKSPADRVLSEIFERHTPRRIVELGVGSGQRALRMIELAKKASPGAEIAYIGMDLFEGRSEADGPGLSLKEAHQQFRGSGAKAQLVPGNPCDSLVRMANALGKVDLLIIPAELESPEHARAWFYVPRVLHERTVVLVEYLSEEGQPDLRIKSQSEIAELARLATVRRAA